LVDYLVESLALLMAVEKGFEKVSQKAGEWADEMEQ